MSMNWIDFDSSTPDSSIDSSTLLLAWDEIMNDHITTCAYVKYNTEVL